MNKQHSQSRSRRNREIGLVQKNHQQQIEERHRMIEQERMKKREVDSFFVSLQKTLAVTHNQDSKWQMERKEIAKIMEEIKVKRNLQAIEVQLLDIPAVTKFEYYVHLINQQKHYAPMESMANEYYAL